MTDMTAEGRQLQAGQTYDPGYGVPDLSIGQRISGHTVIAAIRQIDSPGLLPGLHVVTAYDPGDGFARSTPYVTWEVAWQPSGELYNADGTPAGRWVANSGHYKASRSDALRDMAERAGLLADRRQRLSGGVPAGDL